MSTSAQETSETTAITPVTPEPVAAPPAPDAPTGVSETPAVEVPACARCGAALHPGQEWCLECGAAARTRIAGPRGWRFPMLLAGLVALLAGAGVAVWLVSLSDNATTQASTLTTAAAVAPLSAPTTSASVAAPPVARTTTVTRTKTVTTPGRTVTLPAQVVTAPARTVTVTTPSSTAPSSPSASFPSWPAGTTGYTVIVFSGSKSAADAQAQKLQSAGTTVGVLATSQFSASDAGGPYVVFSGRYPTRAAAEPSATKLSRTEPNAYVGLVKPR